MTPPDLMHLFLSGFLQAAVTLADFAAAAFSDHPWGVALLAGLAVVAGTGRRRRRSRRRARW